MKTTVELTLSEASTILKERLNCDSVVITNTTAVPDPNVLVTELCRIMYVDFSGTYNSTNKINAIKQLRARVPYLSLADAKYAVEQPITAFINHFRGWHTSKQNNG